MPKPFYTSLALETLCGVRDKKNSASIFNSECQHATAIKMALCPPHGAETRFQLSPDG